MLNLVDVERNNISRARSERDHQSSKMNKDLRVISEESYQSTKRKNNLEMSNDYNSSLFKELNVVNA